MTAPASPRADRPPAPPPATVPGNQWNRIAAPEIGAWTPTRTVSVVIPCYRMQRELDITVAALAHQTYPRHLLQVVVADDGSDPPIVSPRLAGDLDLIVRRHERRGYGRARTMALGVEAAEGEVMLHLDADMVPVPEWVEAHARWHHAVSDAVTLGFRIHVDFDGISSEDVARAAAAGSLPSLLAGRPQEPPSWIDAIMERTSDLTAEHDDMFRVLTGGNLGTRAETYREVGGFDQSFSRYGLADTELGFRLYTHGCVLVPERGALCFHQGLDQGVAANPERELHARLQRARVRHLIAHPAFRPPVPGRSYHRPSILARVRVEEEPAEQVVAAVESLLAGDFHDLVLTLSVSAEHPDREWLSEQFWGDPRVLLEDSPDSPDTRFAMLRLDVPPDALLSRETIGLLVGRIRRARVGALAASVPGADASVRLTTTRALRRAERSTPDPARVTAVAAELFGSETVDGATVGVASAIGVEPGAIAKMPSLAERRAREKLAAAQARAESAERRAVAVNSLRAVRLSTALGRLRRARGLRGIGTAVRAVGRALRRPTA